MSLCSTRTMSIIMQLTVTCSCDLSMDTGSRAIFRSRRRSSKVMSSAGGELRNRGRTCSDSYCFAAFSGVEVRGPRPRFLGSGASPWLRWSRRCSEGSYHESVYWSVNHDFSVPG